MSMDFDDMGYGLEGMIKGIREGLAGHFPKDSTYRQEMERLLNDMAPNQPKSPDADKLLELKKTVDRIRRKLTRMPENFPDREAIETRVSTFSEVDIEVIGEYFAIDS